MHFARFGIAMKRSPGPNFDSRFYLARYPDVTAARMSALAHYLRHGRKEGRFPLPGMEQQDAAGTDVARTPDQISYPASAPPKRTGLAAWHRCLYATRAGTDGTTGRGNQRRRYV
ncbi:hypothetical protein CJD35_22045 (plasmid) [Sphingobium xenophagum]|uniref:Uncharacterized protein n=1 Tax=Sphingobium xenophagum TaxID=121428 RepID=A0A249N0M6_SPHXE|nr:hypothetical protein [Sphingobium xenophagum]ASY47148.1 hypothetical protein CJD35_22045 [Sphingobium xenophagum]